jgi:hypothetical protein
LSETAARGANVLETLRPVSFEIAGFRVAAFAE